MIARLAAGLSLALVATLASSLASAAAAVTVAPSHTDLPNEVPVALQTVGAGVLLLTDHPATASAPGVLGKLEARAGVVSGSVLHWTAPLDLSGTWQVYGDSVRTVTASNGLTAIAWDGIDTAQVDPNDQAAVVAGTGQAAVVVVRMPNGTWQGPYSTGQVTAVTDVAADAAGDVAVLGSDPRGRQRTLVRSASGDWRVVTAPGLELESIQMDGHGVLHGVVHPVARGGSGTVAIAHLPAGGSAWSAAKRVRVAGHRVQSAQLVVGETGQETLVVGSDSRQWRSTYDSEAFFATSYQVLQRRHGRFVPIWSRDGAERLTAALGGDGRVQLLWTQDRKPTKRRWPGRFRLLTQQLLPKPGRVTTITSGPTTRSNGVVHAVDADSLALGTAPGIAGVGVLWQGAEGPNAWVGGSATALPTTSASPAVSPSGGVTAVAAMSTAPVVAWLGASTEGATGGYVTAATSVAVLLP